MDTPRKTPADYLLEAVCPALIILLVGSLAFFLIQVFYRGDLVQGVRWTMFWFVLAIVLVSRVGIQQSKRHALFYGIALAIATWIYLVYTHRVPIVGAVLLAITWWCAHLLTVDCTVLREEIEPDKGTLETLLSQLEKPLLPREPVIPPTTLPPLDLLVAADLARRRNRASSRPPGRSVVLFSLAALPLFGLGQLFLPHDDEPARHAGFAFLALYLAAAFGLLVTTSYLGLHRQLRQRAVEIPAGVALAWVRFGAMVAAGVLLLALVLPRPGGYSIWKKLTYHIPHKEHKAAPYAPPFNPPGKDEGAPTSQPTERPNSSANTKTPPSGSGTQPSRNPSPSHSTSPNPSRQPGSDGGGGSGGSGDQGSDGQGGQNGQGGTGADDNSTRRKTIHIKDNTPDGSDSGSNGGGDSGPDGTDPKVHQGNGKIDVKVDPPDQPPKPAKVTKPKDAQKTAEKQSKPPGEEPKPPPDNHGQGQPQPSDWLRRLLRWLAIIAGVLTLIWLLVRFRQPILRAIRAFLEAVRNFIRRLFGLRIRRRKPVPPDGATPAPLPVLEPFAAYENPFVTGKFRTWPRERLLRYTYEALQARVLEQGIILLPQQTPREFCSRLIGQFPDIGPELERFSVYYTHVAFAEHLPEDFEIETVRRLWEHLGDSVAMATR